MNSGKTTGKTIGELINKARIKSGEPNLPLQGMTLWLWNDLPMAHNI